ncbi:MAG: hypothetical protein ACXWQO_19345 [Bdellovibrionota bacterium]
MLRFALPLAALLATQAAWAYSPELLLQKSLVKVPELDSASTKQHLNPFSKITLGLEHQWGSGTGNISDDDKQRLRTRNETTKQNQLTLQLRPKGISEAAAYSKYEKSLENRTDLERKILRSLNAKASYELLIRAAQAKEEKNLLIEWNTILDRSQKLSVITSRSEGDAKAVVRAASEIEKAKGEMAAISSGIAGVKHTLSTRDLKLEELEIDQIVSGPDMQERLASLGGEISSISRDEALADLDMEQKRLGHAVAERSHLVDSLKFSVSKDTGNILRDRFDHTQDSQIPLPGTELIQNESRKGTSYSVGITLNLPFLAAKDLDEQRDRIKLAKQELANQLESEKAAEHTATLRELVKEKLSILTSVTEANTVIPDNLLRSDPALAMDMQRSSMQRRLVRIRMLAEIRALYIELLFETGTLANEPDLNHLSKTNRRIGA